MEVNMEVIICIIIGPCGSSHKELIFPGICPVDNRHFFAGDELKIFLQFLCRKTDNGSGFFVDNDLRFAGIDCHIKRNILMPSFLPSARIDEREVSL